MPSKITTKFFLILSYAILTCTIIIAGEEVTPTKENFSVKNISEEGSLGQSDESETIVYVTKTGKNFHRGDCRYLHSSKIKVTLIGIGINDAKKLYQPCSICKPLKSQQPKQTVKKFDPESVKFTFLKKWKPNEADKGLGADILLEDTLSKDELIQLTKHIADQHDPVVIKIWASRKAWQDKDATTEEFKTDYILFYVKNKTGSGAYIGCNEIRWMQEKGEFSSDFGKKTKF